MSQGQKRPANRNNVPEKRDVEKRLLDAVELQDVLAFVELVHNYYPELDTVLKAGDGIEHLVFFGFASPVFPEFKYQKCRLPEEVISEISRQISDVLKARGSWEETVMEKGREQFLDLIAALFEYSVKLVDGDSGVEHVCYLLDMVIICVVEAQTQFPLDVVAQLLMELYASGRMNRHKGFATYLVYGVLSSVEQWRFYSHGLSSVPDITKHPYFTQSEDIFLKPSFPTVSEDPEAPSAEKVREVADSLFWLMLDGAMRASQQYLRVVKAGIEELVSDLTDYQPLSPHSKDRLQCLQKLYTQADAVIPGLSPLLNDALKAHTDAESQAVISKLAETCRHLRSIRAEWMKLSAPVLSIGRE